jgi:hypothetical protein
MGSESAAMCEGGDACVKKTAGMWGGACEPFSSACVLGSIARVPIPKGSLCFFLWPQRKKRVEKCHSNGGTYQIVYDPIYRDWRDEGK